jgi:hypothetical protein
MQQALMVLKNMDGRLDKSRNKSFSFSVIFLILFYFILIAMLCQVFLQFVLFVHCHYPHMLLVVEVENLPLMVNMFRLHQ